MTADCPHVSEMERAHRAEARARYVISYPIEPLPREKASEWEDFNQAEPGSMRFVHESAPKMWFSETGTFPEPDPYAWHSVAALIGR